MSRFHTMTYFSALILLGFSFSQCGGGDKKVVEPADDGDNVSQVGEDETLPGKGDDDEIVKPLNEFDREPESIPGVNTDDKEIENNDASVVRPIDEKPEKPDEPVLPPQPYLAEVVARPAPDRCDSVVSAATLTTPTVPRGLPLDKLPWTYRIAASEVPDDTFIVYANLSSEKSSLVEEAVLMTQDKQASGDLILSFSDYEGPVVIGEKEDENWSTQGFIFEFVSSTGKGTLTNISTKMFNVITPDEKVIQRTGDTQRTATDLLALGSVEKLTPGGSTFSCEDIGTAVAASWQNFYTFPVERKLKFSEDRSIILQGESSQIGAINLIYRSLNETSGPRLIVEPNVVVATLSREREIVVEPREFFESLESLKTAGQFVNDVMSVPSSETVVTDDSFSEFIQHGVAIAPNGRIQLMTPMSQLTWNDTCGGFESELFSVEEEFVVFALSHLQENRFFVDGDFIQPYYSEIVNTNRRIACSSPAGNGWQDIDFVSRFEMSEN